MAEWSELAQDSLQASNELLHRGRYRSCMSRAYYAAYAAVASELIRIKGMQQQFYHAGNNPSHGQVVAMVDQLVQLGYTREVVRQLKQDAAVAAATGRGGLRPTLSDRSRGGTDFPAASGLGRDNPREKRQMITWSPETVSEKVKERFAAHRHELGGDEVSLAGVQARQEADYWRVLIELDRPTEKMGAFDDVLNEIEDELEQQYQVHVMIVPTVG